MIGGKKIGSLSAITTGSICKVQILMSLVEFNPCSIYLLPALIPIDMRKETSY